LTFLHRFDRKQQVLSKFLGDFNEFSDKFPDMREDDQTKEELHQRTDILSDELWEIAEERKEQAVDERQKNYEIRLDRERTRLRHWYCSVDDAS
jgi:hypothetical protein